MTTMCVSILRKVTIFAAAMLMTSTVYGQVGPGLRVTSESNGLLLTGPASSQSFLMLIAGAYAERIHTQKKYWFRADGIRFEFFSEENSKFYITDIPYRLDDRRVLEMYKSGFLFRNGEPKIRSSWVELANSKTALFWTYDKFVASPDRGAMSEREMFLVLVGPGQVFGLFAPVPSGSSEKATKQLLIRTLGTLTFSET
jgi:hypothetical protein